MILFLLIPVVLAAPTQNGNKNNQYWPQQPQQNYWQQQNNQWQQQQNGYQATQNGNQGQPSSMNSGKKQKVWSTSNLRSSDSNKQYQNVWQQNNNVEQTPNLYQKNNVKQNVWKFQNPQGVGEQIGGQANVARKNKQAQIFQTNPGQKNIWQPAQNSWQTQNGKGSTQNSWAQQNANQNTVYQNQVVSWQNQAQGNQANDNYKQQNQLTEVWQPQINQQTKWRPDSSSNEEQPNQYTNSVWQSQNENNDDSESNESSVSEESDESNCESGQFGGVMGNFNQFKMCVNGQWVVKQCAPGTYFDARSMTCSVLQTQSVESNEVWRPWQNQQPIVWQQPPQQPTQYSQSSEENDSSEEKNQQAFAWQPLNPYQQKQQSSEENDSIEGKNKQAFEWQPLNPYQQKQQTSEENDSDENSNGQSSEEDDDSNEQKRYNGQSMYVQNQNPSQSVRQQLMPTNPWQQIQRPSQAPWQPKPSQNPWQPNGQQQPDPQPKPTRAPTPTPSLKSNQPEKLPTKTHVFYHPFNKCLSGTRRAVKENEDAFEICDNGEWVFMLCAPGTWFEQEFMECTDGYGPAPYIPMPQKMVDAMMKKRKFRSQEESTEDSREDSRQDDSDENTNGVYQNSNGYGDIAAHILNQNMRMVEINGKLHVVPADPALWLDDVREIIVVSVEKCKVGRTREDGDADKYQECLMNPKGITMWIRRKCAPGALYSPWTKNCGKYNQNFNATNPWLYDSEEEVTSSEEDSSESVEDDKIDGSDESEEVDGENGSNSDENDDVDSSGRSDENSNDSSGNGYGNTYGNQNYGINVFQSGSDETDSNQSEKQGYGHNNGFHGNYFTKPYISYQPLNQISANGYSQNNGGQRENNYDTNRNSGQIMLNGNYENMQNNAYGSGQRRTRTQTIRDKDGKKITITLSLDDGY